MDPFQIMPSSGPEDHEVHQKLREYNRVYMRDFADYCFHIKMEGRLAAGIVAGKTMDTLEVEFLFVEEAYRGMGLGSKLLRHAEARAAGDGVKRVLVNTYSFQAPDFYQKHGYTQLFALTPCFGEYSQHFFLKEL